MPEHRRILIADDEEIFLHTTADLLRRKGYECACAPDATSAANLLRDNRYDLLIADIKMPGNGELEFLHALPRLAPGLPAVVVTAYPSLQSAIQSIQLPVTAYLVKPVAFPELLAQVRTALRRIRTKDPHQNDDYYRHLFDNASDGIVSLSPEGIITDANSGLEALLGWSRRELVGQHYRKFIVSSLAAIQDSPRSAASAEERWPSTSEERLRHKDGRIMPVEARTNAIRNTAGEFEGFEIVYRDLSARKALEQQRLDFLATLIHDIKNPVGVIWGYAELLMEMARERGAAEEERMLNGLLSNALSINSLVTNYLDLSRIEAGTLPFSKAPIHINPLLTQVSQRYTFDARRRQITIGLQLQEDLPEVEGDTLALERIVTNLLHNAIQETPRSGKVTISSRQHDGEVVIAVANTGSSIPPEEVASLFQKYHRIVSSQPHAGTGLGLFIVKTLVDAHNGRVTVESTPDRGTVFSVFLPARSVH
jgi:PAS domain S-box-containing protein